jgi:hypothetical protein
MTARRGILRRWGCAVTASEDDASVTLVRTLCAEAYERWKLPREKNTPLIMILDTVADARLAASIMQKQYQEVSARFTWWAIPSNRDAKVHPMSYTAEELSRLFVCPRCGVVSHNPNDLAEGYCRRCGAYTVAPGAPD